MDREYKYWEVWYISCESNERWLIVKTPVDWEDYDVESRLPLGGCGDDISEVTSINESCNEDYSWDLCDYKSEEDIRNDKLEDLLN